MRTETITTTTNIYKFDELSEQSQQAAIQHLRDMEDFDYLFSEIRDTIKEVEKHFRFRCDYSFGIDGIRKNRIIDYPNYTVQELLDLIPSGDCPFTGVCYDEDFLCGLRNSDEDNVSGVLRDGMHELFRAAIKEMDYQTSDEAIKEKIHANDYEFKEDGEVY